VAKLGGGENMAEVAAKERPELVFALAGPLGTNLPALSEQLAKELQGFGYKPIRIRVSALLPRFQDWKAPEENSAAARVRHLQRMANTVRRRLKDGAVLARAAVAEIRHIRSIESGHPDKAAT
jgi:hypothetical protein